MTKLEALGCGTTVVRLVVPTGYSFNLDGTCIYLTMAAGFVAQALDVPLAGLTLLLGIDRFMSEARALTNLVGNAVATIVVAKWENDFVLEQAKSVLNVSESTKTSE